MGHGARRKKRLKGKNARLDDFVKTDKIGGDELRRALSEPAGKAFDLEGARRAKELEERELEILNKVHIGSIEMSEKFREMNPETRKKYEKANEEMSKIKEEAYRIARELGISNSEVPRITRELVLRKLRKESKLE